MNTIEKLRKEFPITYSVEKCDYDWMSEVVFSSNDIEAAITVYECLVREGDGDGGSWVITVKYTRPLADLEAIRIRRDELDKERGD